MSRFIESGPLHDFEDNIRIEALTLGDALEFQSREPNETYVIGSGIGQGYVGVLRELGFKDMWQVLRERPVEYVERVREHLNTNDGIANRSSMYAYVDYVLEDLNANLMIFLPPKSFIISYACVDFGGAAGDEIVRALHHFPNKYSQISFATGLFDITHEEFARHVKTLELS